ncbi:MAG: DUF1292 domain-containing protein [Clostridia bacterium]|nr:DUF1292 domain-containing protein [Clostridia bacterium]
MNNNDREILSLTDEDGKLLDFEFVGTVEYDENEYYVLVPLEDNDEGAYIILRAEDAEDGDINLVSIEDDEEYDSVADLVEDEFFSEIDYDGLKGNE